MDVRLHKARMFVLLLFCLLSLHMVSFAFNTTINVTIEEGNETSISSPASVSGGDYDITVGKTGNVQTDMERVFTGVLDIVAAAGAVVFSFGLGKMFLAFKDERPEEKAGAMNMLIAGILVMSIGTLMKTFTGIGS